MPHPRNLHAEAHASANNVRELRGGTSLDDATLVSRALGGDRGAEEALYHRHFHYVMGMVVRLLADRDEAEDVVQDTFANAFDRLSSLRQPENARAWIAQIAVSQVQRRVRKKRLLARLGLHPPADAIHLEALAADAASGETVAELAAVGRVLAELGASERIAWMLQHVEGCGLEEVAALCDCSLATAKRRIAAAKDHLRERLADLLEVP
ncbi:MAG TPA: RNA polymerase sigma factor [Polyangiaceae bacterium]|nr:RNA polymerase sigma factor [Polyangiaceae bacterium]